MTLHIAAFSGGKDSTAMVLRMIEKNERLDKVVFCDTGMEFPAMYDHIAKVREFIEKEGVEFVTLKSEHDFYWYFSEKEVESKEHGSYNGYAWPGMHMRWCTRHLKIEVQERYFKTLNEDVVKYVGLAADEQKRIERKNNQRNRHPLAEWGWTEDICLGYCYGRGFDWYDPSIGKGLYEIFPRTSCWICPLGTLDNFRKLRHYYPDLWEKIGKMEACIKAQRQTEKGIDEIAGSAWKYTPRTSWCDLDARFSKEDETSITKKEQTVIDAWGK